MDSENISQIPETMNPKTIARAYMEGKLSKKQFPKQGGIARWIQLAENPRNSTACHQALTALAELAELDRTTNTENHEINLIPIAIEEGKIVPIKSA